MFYLLIGVFFGIWIDQSFTNIPNIQILINKLVERGRRSEYARNWGVEQKEDSDEEEE